MTLPPSTIPADLDRVVQALYAHTAELAAIAQAIGTQYLGSMRDLDDLLASSQDLHRARGRLQRVAERVRRASRQPG